MNRLLASAFLMVAGIGVQLGQYWYTFGLWPRSWGAFGFFTTLTILLVVLRIAQEKDV